MTIDADIRDQAYQFFIQEAPELLYVIETELVNLVQERSTNKIHNMMRAAHSLKGGAASVGLPVISQLSHRLEDFFKTLHHEGLIIDNELEGLLLEAFDLLRLSLNQQIDTGNIDPDHIAEVAAPILTNIEDKLGHFLGSETELPNSIDLGVDIALSIFEVDVAEGLESLRNILDHPRDHIVAGELRAQAEVFSGIAELLNMPGLGDIAHATIAALDANPSMVTEIAHYAIQDFEAARQGVIAGDRTQGGKPSSELLALSNSEAPLPEFDELDDLFSDRPSDLDLLFADAPSLNVNDIDAEPYLDQVFDDFAIAESELSLDDLFRDLTSEVSDQVSAELSGDPVISPNSLFDLDDVFGSEEDQEDLGDRNNLLLDDVFGDISLGNLEDLSESTLIPETLIPETLIPETIVAEPKIKPSIIAKSFSYTSPKVVASAAAESQLSMRINLDRLEQMNNLVGELVINRNVLSLQNEQLQAIIQELLSRFNNFRRITQRLRTVADQTASSDRYRSNGAKTNGTNINSQDDFDSLELDTYTELYGVMQAALEDLAQIEETVEDVTLLSGQSTQTLEQQRQTVTRLRDDLVWARMLPLSEVLNRFPRNIRDLSSKYKKPVDLKLSGTGVLVDKAILEKLYDPLQHLLRNAFDHGIEASDIRLEQEKSARGQIEIRAYHQGSQTVIEVKDDGQGINLDQIRRKAISQTLISDTQVLTDPQLLDLIFQPGFSTSDKVSELSGRGVGLDVVRSQIQSLKGSVSVAFKRGQGTTFTLRIPLTLSIANLLICVVGTSVVAIASSSIEEIVVPKSSQVHVSEGKRLLQWREQTIPIRHLSEFLDFRCPLPESLPNSSLVSVPTPSDWALPLLIIRRNQEILALEIDRLVTEQELAIKPLGASISPPKFIYGCTILGDGSLIPILDGQEILGQINLVAPITPSPKIVTPQSETLLIVDDSIALRQTLALTLQKAGFRVLQAKDGQEAIEQLEKNTTIQLVICDVEMPNMNGFEFLTHRRQNPNLNKTPVVMLTSRSSDKHRRLAMHLGASSYFTKPYLEREFISAIKNMLIPQP
jgi:chemotaxis family two-component system sensor histidine kinase/response regulator PixL